MMSEGVLRPDNRGSVVLAERVHVGGRHAAARHGGGQVAQRSRRAAVSRARAGAARGRTGRQRQVGRRHRVGPRRYGVRERDASTRLDGQYILYLCINNLTTIKLRYLKTSHLCSAN